MENLNFSQSYVVFLQKTFRVLGPRKGTSVQKNNPLKSDVKRLGNKIVVTI